MHSPPSPSWVYQSCDYKHERLAPLLNNKEGFPAVTVSNLHVITSQILRGLCPHPHYVVHAHLCNGTACGPVHPHPHYVVHAHLCNGTACGPVRPHPHYVVHVHMCNGTACGPVRPHPHDVVHVVMRVLCILEDQRLISSQTLQCQ